MTLHGGERDVDGLAKAKTMQPSASRLSLMLGLGLLLAGVLLLGLWAGLKARRASVCLGSALARQRTLQTMVPEGHASPAALDFMTVGTELHGLQEDLACLRTEVREFVPLAPLLGWLPKIGREVASAPDLLEMAQSLVDGGVLVLDSLSPLLEQIGQDNLGDAESAPAFDLPQVVAVLDGASASLIASEQELERAAELLSDLDGTVLSPRVGRLLDLTDRYLPILLDGVRMAQAAPRLLGQEGDRTYLILAQNDDERRPTGGWISGMGLVRISAGRIEEVRFIDSWVVDNLGVPHDPPPDSLHRAMWAEMWLFRDANWSPDFPTSAQVAERILSRDQDLVVDGVIAVNQRALQMLVAALEPVAVESSQEPITGSNVLGYMREAWSEPQEGLTLTESWAEWTLHRKDFMSELVQAILDKLQSQEERVDLLKLTNMLRQALAERHILVYLHDAEASEVLAAQGWDGALLETNHDYLQVVDASVGFNKVDPNVQRSISYDVMLSESGRARAEAVVTYQNISHRDVEECVQGVEFLPTYTERMHGCYWNYVRFYVPEGALLLSQDRVALPPGSLLSRHQFIVPPGDAGPDIGPAEKGKSSYGLFFVLAPGQQRAVRMAWELPAGVLEPVADGWLYELTVQKQSGTPTIPLQVTVNLPTTAELIRTLPSPSSTQGNVVRYDLLLGIDQRIELVFQD